MTMTSILKISKSAIEWHSQQTWFTIKVIWSDKDIKTNNKIIFIKSFVYKNKQIGTTINCASFYSLNKSYILMAGTP